MLAAPQTQIGVKFVHSSMSRQAAVLITSTGASTRIEGARLSDEDIEKMRRGIHIQKFTDRDKQEAQGYYELLENVFNSWKRLKFSESAIKHFHQELLKYVDKDVRHRGEYKKSENKVHMIDETGQSIGILFDTAPAWQTPGKMRDLVEWTQKNLGEAKYHPLLVIGNFLVEFLKIHPFTDGNGRLSRVLTNLLLLQAGYVYIPYVSHEKINRGQQAGLLHRLAPQSKINGNGKRKHFRLARLLFEYCFHAIANGG